jgi:hypothetical protein
VPSLIHELNIFWDTSMSQETVLLAVQAFIKSHPDFPDDYFQTKHRANTGRFGKKVYLSKIGNGWKLVELNYIQRFFRRSLLILSFGAIKLYGDLYLNRTKLFMQPNANVSTFSNKAISLYEGLMSKAFGLGKAPANSRTNIKKDNLWVRSESNASFFHESQSFNKQQTLLMQIIDKERIEKNNKVRLTMQKTVVAIAQKHYKSLFQGIDQLTNNQRSSLIHLLNADTKLSLGIWNGVMYHGKSFQQSTIENVRSWIPGIINALSLEQLKVACKDNKFWEVIELFPHEVGTALSLEQWKCMLKYKPDAELIVKLMLQFPVDNLLYDKLLLAAGKIPIDFGKELGIQMLISRLGRYLVDKQDKRSIDVLTKGLKIAPRKSVTAITMFNTSNKTESPSVSAAPIRLLPLVNVVARATTSQWENEKFNQVANDLRNTVTDLKNAQLLFWELLPRFSSVDNKELSRCKQCLVFLIRYYPASVFPQMDDLSETEIQQFLTAIELTDAALITGVWDNLMLGASEFGFNNESMATTKAQRVLKYVTPQQLSACVNDNKLWAVLRHYSDLVGNTFSAQHFKVLAPNMNEPVTMAKIIADLPLNNDLVDKLAAICPYMTRNASLEMQMSSKIYWVSANINKNWAQDLQKMVDVALGVTLENSCSSSLNL